VNKLYLGVRTQGKSTLAIYQAKASGKPVAIYDASLRITNFPEVTAHNGEELEQLLAGSRFIVYQPQDAYEEFGEFSEILWECEPLALVLDEAWALQGPSWGHPELEKWIRTKDVETVDVMQTAHSASDIWARCRSLAHEWYVFRTNRPQDLAVIEEQCGAEFAARLQTLKPREYLKFDTTSWEISAGQPPASWFIPLRKENSHAGSENRERNLSRLRLAVA
jgi:hypothetical protein